MKLLSSSSTGTSTASAVTVTFSIFLFFVQLTSAAGAPSWRPPRTSHCSDELLKLTICLPYISSSPNNLTDTPSRECCDECVSAFSAGDGVCLCYLVRQPLIFGFPINSSRVLSLTSLCPIRNKATNTSFSLRSLCSGYRPALPPLHSIRGPRRPRSPPHAPAPSGHRNDTEDRVDPPAPAAAGKDDALPRPGRLWFRLPPSSATMKINKRDSCLSPAMLLISLLVTIINK